MKKFFVLSSWSRKAIGSIFIMAFAFVGCDDSSSASAGQNDEPGVESSSSIEHGSSSSSEKAKSSSSDTQSDAGQSSSSEKDKSSSSSAEMQSSSSETVANSSSSVSELSSSSLDGFDWSLPKETYLNPEIEYDTIIDSRDGKVYRTVEIGDQIWMAENLNYADSAKTPSLKGKSWCYNNEPKNCDVAGRLYTWAAAIDSVKLANDVDNPQNCGYDKKCTLPAKAQGICPPDWHLPDKTEWYTLFKAVGGQFNAGKALKSQTGWYGDHGNGTNAFGFSALPAGHGFYTGYFDGDGGFANFWSATEWIGSDAYDVYLIYRDSFRYSPEYAQLDSDDKRNAFSVRCVKD